MRCGLHGTTRQERRQAGVCCRSQAAPLCKGRCDAVRPSELQLLRRHDHAVLLEVEARGAALKLVRVVRAGPAGGADLERRRCCSLLCWQLAAGSRPACRPLAVQAGRLSTRTRNRPPARTLSAYTQSPGLTVTPANDTETSRRPCGARALGRRAGSSTWRRWSARMTRFGQAGRQHVAAVASAAVTPPRRTPPSSRAQALSFPAAPITARPLRAAAPRPAWRSRAERQPAQACRHGPSAGPPPPTATTQSPAPTLSRLALFSG